MMLVRPTNASTKVMYALAAAIPPPGLKVSTDCPPPKTPARSSPCEKKYTFSIRRSVQRKRLSVWRTLDTTHASKTCGNKKCRVSGMHAWVGGREGVNVHSFARWRNTPSRPALSLRFGRGQNLAVLQELGTLGCWLLRRRGRLRPLPLWSSRRPRGNASLGSLHPSPSRPRPRLSFPMRSNAGRSAGRKQGCLFLNVRRLGWQMHS